MVSPADPRGPGALGLACLSKKIGNLPHILLEFSQPRAAWVAQQNLDESVACRYVNGQKVYVTLSVKQVPGPQDKQLVKAETSRPMPSNWTAIVAQSRSESRVGERGRCR